MTDKFAITKEWLVRNKTEAGGWTAHQLRTIGVWWPPKKGWMEQACRSHISHANKAKFEELAKKPK